MRDKEYKSIALICKNKAKSEEIYDILKEKDDSINLIDDDKAEFKIGVNIIPSYLAKGLEFDGVIVIDGENYFGENDKNLFYTVCTRALHELHILANKDIKKFLPKDKSLYTVSEEK